MTDNKITDEEIKSSLEVIATTRNCNECKIRNCKWGTCNCSQITANAALGIINRQQAKIENLEYKLLGVMHFVDKWLDGAELEQDEVNRAATMREKTLQITEKQQEEIERLKAFKLYFDELYGKGLDVANWHLNSELEPFDNFYESALQEVVGEK